MSRDVSAAADRNTDNDETQLTELVEDSLTTLHVSLTKLVEDSLSIVHVSDAAERNTVIDTHSNCVSRTCCWTQTQKHGTATQHTVWFNIHKYTSLVNASHPVISSSHHRIINTSS
jgi:hypothetical protein